jgi:hypothetical protein
MKIHRISPLVVVLTTAAALSAGCMTRGSGTERRESRQAEAFTEIDVGGIFDVRVQVGPETSVEIVGDDNIVPLVETTVSGGRLHLETSESISPDLDLVVNITTPDLRALRTSGSCDVNVRGLSGDEFELDASGVADITLAGVVQRLDLELSGAGRVDALGLTAQSVKVDMSGAGKADVHAERSLVADVSGAGSVSYAGNPTDVQRHVSGVGKVRPR